MESFEAWYERFKKFCEKQGFPLDEEDDNIDLWRSYYDDCKSPEDAFYGELHCSYGD